jgi:hypothetical protein
MMSIGRNGAADAKAGSLSGVHVSFALPDRTGTYGIVHLRRVGERQAWIEEKPGKATRDRAALETDIASAGVYALVRIVSAATNEASATAE